MSCSFIYSGLSLLWFNLFLGILFFDAIVNGIVFLISGQCLSDSLLLVYRNAAYFCTLILYPAALLNLFILTGFFRFFFWWSILGFLYIISCHLQIVTVLLLSFQFGCIFFLFLL